MRIQRKTENVVQLAVVKHTHTDNHIQSKHSPNYNDLKINRTIKK